MATTLPSHVRRILKNENVKFSAHQNKYFIYFWGDFFFHQETNSSCACPCLTVCSPFCLLLPSAWLCLQCFIHFIVFLYLFVCYFLSVFVHNLWGSPSHKPYYFLPDTPPLTFCFAFCIFHTLCFLIYWVTSKVIEFHTFLCPFSVDTHI